MDLCPNMIVLALAILNCLAMGTLDLIKRFSPDSRAMVDNTFRSCTGTWLIWSTGH